MSKKSKSKKRRIRPLALCVFRHKDKIFVARGYDKHAGETFYRPIGGRIEFGERGADTVAREVLEEIGAQTTDMTYLGTLENIFTYEGERGHEITLIFDGRFIDPALNDENVRLRGADGDKVLYEASWKALDFFRKTGAPPLYPQGLLSLLDSSPAP